MTSGGRAWEILSRSALLDRVSLYFVYCREWLKESEPTEANVMVFCLDPYNVMSRQPCDLCSLVPRLSLRLAYRAGQRSYVKLLRGRREEPGNEASTCAQTLQHTLASFPVQY